MSGTELVARRSIIETISQRYNMEATAFEQTVRATCFPATPPATKEEFAAGMQIAFRLELNPITKEVHFARTKGGGIQAIIGVDGWYTIANRHPKYDGCQFDYEWNEAENGRKLIAVTCRIFRKDRSKPDEVTEFMAECQRPSEAWRLTPSRMLRHRAFGQCARIAFAFAGVMDQDEFGKWQEESEPPPTKRKSSAASKRDGSTETFNALRVNIEGAPNADACLNAWVSNAEFLKTAARGWFDMLAMAFVYRMKDCGEDIDVNDHGWPILSNEQVERANGYTAGNEPQEEVDKAPSEDQGNGAQDDTEGKAAPLDNEAADAAFEGFTAALADAHTHNMITRIWNRYGKARDECDPPTQAKFLAAKAAAMKRVNEQKLQAAE